MAKEKTTAHRIAPAITAASAAVKMPEKPKAARGSKSLYPFDDLTEVGMSFGVKDKTAKNMASIVSNQNRKNVEPRKDEAGNVIYKTKAVKGADGTETQMPTDKPEVNVLKHFFVIDVDPKKDPDNASVRVFRDV
jgi:hypothetical protein